MKKILKGLFLFNKVFPEKKTWQEAMDFCKAQGDGWGYTLGGFETEEEFNTIKNDIIMEVCKIHLQSPILSHALNLINSLSLM